MLIVIGLALILYGYFSYKYSNRWSTESRRRAGKTALPEWFPLLIKVGGVLLILTGALLIVSYLLI